jgi:hypothetical protein
VAPNISGSYAILTRLNLTDGLPEPWSTNVQFVGEIFADPVRSLVDFLFGDPNDNGDGFLGRFLDDTPSRRTLVTGALTDLILATDIGQRLDRFFGVGGEAYRVVTEFGMAGTMDIRSEPGEDGQLGSNNGHRYDDIVIDWTIDCDPNDLECSRVVVNLSSIDNVGALSSTFSGEVGQGPRLFVDRHGFEFNYGAIAVAIMERVVLPRTFGVNSIEGALGLLVDCDDFGDSIFPNNVVFSLGVSEACEFALEAVADEVVERLSGANLGLPDLTLATFGTEAGLERAGCLMGEPEYTSQDVLRRVSTLGSEQTRCEWDALFETSDGTGAVRSDFHATGR